MAEITAQMVQALREATNVGMMECKKALVEAGGDKERAIKILRERGVAIAAKKASRAANQGLICASVTADGKSGSLIEVNCETDFVAKNPGFQTFVKKLAELAAGQEGVLADMGRDDVVAKIAEIGENIVARRSVRFVRTQPGLLATYIHLNGKLGVMVELGCGKDATASTAAFKALALDLTLHVTACAPQFLKRDEVDANLVAAEREIYAKQMQGKPDKIIGKIVDGKMQKFYGQVCFLEQGFVREPEVSVTALLQAKGKELGDELTIRRFVRFQLGE